MRPAPCIKAVVVIVVVEGMSQAKPPVSLLAALPLVVQVLVVAPQPELDDVKPSSSSLTRPILEIQCYRSFLHANSDVEGIAGGSRGRTTFCAPSVARPTHDPVPNERLWMVSRTAQAFMT